MLVLSCQKNTTCFRLYYVINISTLFSEYVKIHKLRGDVKDKGRYLQLCKNRLKLLNQQSISQLNVWDKLNWFCAIKQLPFVLHIVQFGFIILSKTTTFVIINVFYLLHFAIYSLFLLLFCVYYIIDITFGSMFSNIVKKFKIFKLH